MAYICTAAFIFLLMFTQAATAQFGSAGSSRQMKKSMVKSFLFESSDLFYPDGLPEDTGALPVLNKKQIRKLSKNLNRLHTFLGKKDDEIVSLLTSRFGAVDVDAGFKRIEIVRNNSAILATSSKRYLFMDLKVLQAIFAAALIESVDDSVLTDRQKMERFFDFKKEVRESKSFGILGDLFGDLDSPWFSMVDFTDKSRGLEMRYLSTLLFAMSHELGHLSLRHFDNTNHSDTLNNHKREFDADAFAVLMMTVIFQNQIVLDNFSFNDYSFRTLLGDEIFFNKAFVLAEFQQNLATHPPVEERKRRIEDLYNSFNLN